VYYGRFRSSQMLIDLSSVLCVVFLLYQPRQEGKKRKGKKADSQPGDQQTNGCLFQHPAVTCYKKLILGVVVEYYIHLIAEVS
jgi:hypothetical protein